MTEEIIIKDPSAIDGRPLPPPSPPLLAENHAKPLPKQTPSRILLFAFLLIALLCGAFVLRSSETHRLALIAAIGLCVLSGSSLLRSRVDARRFARTNAFGVQEFKSHRHATVVLAMDRATIAVARLAQVLSLMLLGACLAIAALK